ncbi:MAG TPA: universal stress protein [Nitrososphaerales archaeon]|nr:universal stress protein [Nitrososphaerales archaeon]
MPFEPQFRKILVAYDGSPDSKRALRTGSLLAKRMRSKLLIVHVFSPAVFPYIGASPAPLDGMSALQAAAKKQSEALLARAVKSVAGQVRARGLVVESGSAVEGIIETASREDVDLIVMGTQGLTGFKKILVGSVSSGVVAHAKCAVLVAK